MYFSMDKIAIANMRKDMYNGECVKHLEVNMYKLLLATDQKDIREAFENHPFREMGFHRPLIASTSEEAIELLNSHAIDAVGYYFEKKNGEALSQYLHYDRPSTAIFAVSHESDKQLLVLRELAEMMRRLHSDYADEPYDSEAMRTFLRDELTHNLLAGHIEDFAMAERQFKLLRSHISFTRPCMVYELDMPQGEVYMTMHRNGVERLERALRNNFFGRYIDRIYYAVAVLTPRHIRVAAIPKGGESQDMEDFITRANLHMEDSIERIKEYLDLDINVDKCGMIPNLKAFSPNSNIM